MSLTEILRRELAGIIELSSDQLERLAHHHELLLRWNRKLNLTTVTDVDEAATRHYCESLFLASRLSAGTVVDVGSGAGFPGIPIAIARPDCRVDLVESHQRKSVFLREAIREVPNARVLAARAEAIASPRYNWITARAVDPAFVLTLGLAHRYALLVGAADAQSIVSSADAPPIAGPVIELLPWGERRVLVTGEFHVKRV